MTKLISFTVFVATSITPSAPANAALSVADPRCEGLREGPQVDTPTPRFSWRLESEARGVRQTAYQIRIAEIDSEGRSLGKPVGTTCIESEDTQWVTIRSFGCHACGNADARVSIHRNEARAER